MTTEAKPETEKAKPLSPSLRPVVLPGVVAKLVLGARYGIAGDQATITFEDDAVQMHMEDFDIALRAAKRLKEHRPQRVTPGVVVDLAGLAHKCVSDEIFAPGSVRVLYYPVVEGGSAFYRCHLPALALKESGKVIAAVSRVEVAREAIDFDVIVFQIGASPKTYQFASTLKRLGKKIVFEFDDAFDLLEPWHPGYEFYSRPEAQENLAKMMDLADCVTVSTRFLENRYRSRCRRIEVVPNFSLFGQWPKREKNDTGRFRVLWAGSPSHIGDLAQVAGALSRFAARHEDATLVFFGRRPVDLGALADRIEFHDWVKFDDYPAMLADMKADVAIAPLADVPFNHAKSNVKLLDYGCAGYPIIASNVGPYAETLAEVPEPEFVAVSTEEEWTSALELAYQNRPFREMMSKRSTALARRYDIAANAPKIEKLFVDLAKEG
jgi:glycosyltransferase involved in cell wall biosynthesis